MGTGIELRRIREAEGLSAAALAALIGINVERLRKWESKGFEPRGDDVNAITSYFEIEVLEELTKIQKVPRTNGKFKKFNEQAPPKPRVNPHHISNPNPMIPLGDYDPDTAPDEVTKGGNQFITLANGQYLMITELVDQYSHNGYGRGWKDPEYIEELPKFPVIVDRLHKGTYRTFEGKDWSMFDGTDRSISPGDYVTGRSVPRHYWRDKLHYKDWDKWIIHHKTEGLMTKEIIDQDVKNGTITLHSWNPDKEQYPDVVVPLDELEEIYNVTHHTKLQKPRH